MYTLVFIALSTLTLNLVLKGRFVSEAIINGQMSLLENSTLVLIVCKVFLERKFLLLLPHIVELNEQNVYFW